jgi:hypothetical protein
MNYTVEDFYVDEKQPWAARTKGGEVTVEAHSRDIPSPYHGYLVHIGSVGLVLMALPRFAADNSIFDLLFDEIDTDARLMKNRVESSPAIIASILAGVTALERHRQKKMVNSKGTKVQAQLMRDDRAGAAN